MAYLTRTLPLAFVVASAAPLAASGDDDAIARVRLVLDALRSAESVARFELHFPPPPPVEIHETLFEHELRSMFLEYGLLWVQPGADAVTLLRIRLLTYPLGYGSDPASGMGSTVEQARLSRSEYERMLRAVWLARHVTLVERSQVVRVPHRDDANGVVAGTVRLSLGDHGELQATFPQPRRGPLITTEIDVDARTVLCQRVLTDALRRTRFTPCEVPRALLTRIRGELDTIKPWRQDLRVTLLGWFGAAEDLDVLRSLATKSPVAQQAVRRIVALTEASLDKDRPTALIELLEESEVGLREWARDVLRTRFGAAYRTELERRYDNEPDAERRRAILREFRRIGHGDTRLSQKGATDPSSAIRVFSAYDLGDTDALMRVAADKTLRGTDEDVRARCSAVFFLTCDGRAPDRRDVIGTLLSAILRDTEDDVRVRHAAALGLGSLGYAEGVPVLLGLLGQSRDKSPVYLTNNDASDRRGRDASTAEALSYELLDDIRLGAVAALGLLRAREGEGVLLSMLTRELGSESSSAAALALEIGEALARIGSRRAEDLMRSIVEESAAPERPLWERRLRLLRAVLAGDPVGMLDAEHSAPPAFVVRLLAEAAAIDKLTALAEQYREDRDEREALIRRALAIARARSREGGD